VISRLRSPELVARTLRAVGIALGAVYIAWNAFWLCQGIVPQSLFKALTGWPSPTTGGTRSIKQLLAGNWVESLRYNLMAVPICLLLFASVACLGWQGLRGWRLSLPRWIVWAWAIVLSMAWVFKLCSDPQYW
jgi:hypothetical protein